MKCLAASVAAVVAVSTDYARSQTVPAPSPMEVAAVPAAACRDCLTIPALAPVRIEILVDLGSKISRSGQQFPLRLAAPIIVDGHVVIAAGATGVGEVVHAKPSGGSGAAGELVLAARYLDIGDRRLRLRSLHVAANGQSKIGTVNAIHMASAATIAPVALVGFMIHGKQSVLAKGTLADAKTAEAFAVAPADRLPQPLAPQDASKKGI